MNIRTKSFLLISLPLLLSACAGQSIQKGETPQKDIEPSWKAEIEQRLDSLSTAMPTSMKDMNEEHATFKAKIAALEVDSTKDYTGANKQIDVLSIQIATVEKEMKSLQSRLQTLEDIIEEQTDEKQLEDGEQADEKQLEDGEQALEDLASIKDEPKKAVAQLQVDRAKKAYYASYFALKNGDYFEASLGFKHFIRDFPESELLAEANYWYGEALLAQGDAAVAIQVFQEIIDSEATTARHAAAMLKAGSIYEEQLKMSEATSVYNNLIRQHPTSSEAETARSRLQRKKEQ